MPANSNFQQAIREAQSSALIGPNVVNKALPYVGGGMALTGLGVLGGLSLQATNNPLFGPLFIVAFIAEIVLFFMASSAANNANNSKALPLLTGFSLLPNDKNTPSLSLPLISVALFAPRVLICGSFNSKLAVFILLLRTLWSSLVERMCTPPRYTRVTIFNKIHVGLV